MTLALEEAVAREAWSEIDMLFDRRERLIQQLRSMALDPRSVQVVAEVRRVDDRIAKTLTEGKAAVQADLQAGARSRKAAKAYAQNATIAALDRAS